MINKQDGNVSPIISERHTFETEYCNSPTISNL